MTAIVGAYNHNVGASVSAGAAYVYDGVNNGPATCCIGGASYASGTVDPTNACLLCTPTSSTTTWSDEGGRHRLQRRQRLHADRHLPGRRLHREEPGGLRRAADQCHVAGTCNPSTGTCSNPTRERHGCNDGNACTQTDTCQSGACTGANPVVCTAGPVPRRRHLQPVDGHVLQPDARRTAPRATTATPARRPTPARPASAPGATRSSARRGTSATPPAPATRGGRLLQPDADGRHAMQRRQRLHADRRLPGRHLHGE